MSWKGFSSLSVDERIELIRSEVFLSSAVNNMLIFALLVVISVMGPGTLFTVWIPGLLFVFSAVQVVNRWSANALLVRRLRGDALQGVVMKCGSTNYGLTGKAKRRRESD